MRPDILPQLVNGPEGDPAVYANFKYERRAFLFDLGDVHAMSARSLLRVSHVFVSHTHVDHFIGFDHLLRIHLGREKALTLYGPPGFADNVEAKLRAYSWNLVENYPQDLRIEAVEVGDRPLRVASFSCKERFGRRDGGTPPCFPDGPVILDEPGLQVASCLLEHDIPCLAYALQEKQHINLDKVRLQAMGLRIGPWIRVLKEAVRNGEPDDTPIPVLTAGTGRGAAKGHVPLGQLRDRVLRITRGQKIAYVTDAAFTDQNVDRIVRLVREADVLFCEAAFSEEDRSRAADRRHLTAGQAGLLAREAGVRRLVPFHFSPKYHARIQDLYEEASKTFGRPVGPWRQG